MRLFEAKILSETFHIPKANETKDNLRFFASLMESDLPTVLELVSAQTGLDLNNTIASTVVDTKIDETEKKGSGKTENLLTIIFRDDVTVVEMFGTLIYNNEAFEFDVCNKRLKIKPVRQ